MTEDFEKGWDGLKVMSDRKPRGYSLSLIKKALFSLAEGIAEFSVKTVQVFSFDEVKTVLIHNV
jgi:hypothetical protein